MRLLLDDMIAELKLRLSETKSLRQKVLIKDARKALKDLKSETEKKL